MMRYNRRFEFDLHVQALINSQQAIKPSLKQETFPGDDSSDSDSD